MKKVLKNILAVSMIVSLLIIVGVSCNTTPTDKSWGNPEEFVLYDVNKYISIALNNNQKLLKKEYGNELAKLGTSIWDHYSFGGKKPKLIDIDRFADGCWVIASDTFIGSPGDCLYDETTFYYRFCKDRWQLAFIRTEVFDDRGYEIKEGEIQLIRDIEYK